MADLRGGATGSGPVQCSLQREVQRLGLDESVPFLGHVDQDLPLEQYARGQVDIVVLARLDHGLGSQEGILVSLMEAMAAQVPVVATNSRAPWSAGSPRGSKCSGERNWPSGDRFGPVSSRAS